MATIHMVSAKTFALFLGLTVAACGGGGGGGFEKALDDILEEPQYVSFTTGDVDSDGYLDIVFLSGTVDPASTSLGIVPGTGAGFGASSTSYQLGTDPSDWPGEVLLVDLNADALPDAVVSHDGLSVYGSKIRILMQQPSGQFVVSQTMELGRNPDNLAYGDLDLDGLPDIVVAAIGGAYVMLNDSFSPGQFQAPQQLSAASTGAVDIADMNGDGLADVVTAQSDTVRVYWNSPASVGTLVADNAVPVTGTPNDLIATDINSDGLLDIVMSNGSSDTYPNRASISMLLQDQQRNLTVFTEHVIAGANNMIALSVSDLNDDHRPDIAATIWSATGNEVVILQATQTGFVAPTFLSFDSPSRPWSIEITDVNTDTLADILVSAADGIYAFHQQATGNGAFGNGVRIID